MTEFPLSAPVKKLNQEHPEFSMFKEAWDQICTLYEGGVKIREAVSRGQFLTKNPKELPEVFAVRQKQFSYTNLLGNVIGWYMSALFKQPPQLVHKKAGVDGDAAAQVAADVSDFCIEFEGDCDRGGTGLNDFWRKVAEATMLYRHAYVLVDLPEKDSAEPVNLYQQKQQGLLNPFLVLYKPSNVIDWQADAYGNLDWLVVYVRVQDQAFLEAPKLTDYWYYFDREQVALYGREVNTGATMPGDLGSDEMAKLIEGYPRPHAMADQKRVPVTKVSLPEGLWLANRVFLPLVNHLNQDNALDFGLMQANLPQLVIEDGLGGGYEEPVTTSVVGYHKVPNGGKMYYLEPGGKSYEAAQKRIDGLEERVYKACYLMDQARTNKSTPAQQSGVSKQQDKTPSRDALSGIGDVMRAAEQKTYADVLTIAGYEDIEPDVRGFDFADRATAEDMDLLEQGTIIPVNSVTFEREVSKKAVRFVLPDANPETHDKIDEEIEANPTPSEVDAAAQEQQRQDQVNQFQLGLKANAV